MQELLSTLGYEKTNIQIIRDYLRGKTVNSNLYFSRDNILNQNKSTTRMLFWYLRLLNYSLKKNTDRRNSLYGISQAGIRQNISSKNYMFARIILMRLIKHRRKKLEYFEGLLDFLDELEQIAFNKN